MKEIFSKIKARTVLFLSVVGLFVLFLGAPSLSLKSVKANNDAGMECSRYDVNVTINDDRTVLIEERITIKFLTNRFTMFYKALPKDSIYTDFQVSCAGNDEFTFYVEEDPYYDEFIDLCMVGGAERGNVWTYDISYVMTPAGEDVKNGMRLDVVGGGTTFPLENVTVTVHFPDAPIECKRYLGGYGDERFETPTGWSSDGKTLVIHEDVLELVYNDTFEENTAEPITLEFTFENGVLDGFTATQMWTGRTWIVLLVGVLTLGVSLGLYFFGKHHRDLVPIVNIKAPQEMDPMKMGHLIDGAIDDEDVTSMLYYFASKGYLKIDFSNESDPVLIRGEGQGGFPAYLPSDAPAYQKTLFDGLFKNGKTRVALSELTNVYYATIDAAKLQLSVTKMKRYERKSLLGFWGGILLTALACALIPYLVGLFIYGGAYHSSAGIFSAIMVAIAGILWISIRDLEFKSSRKVVIGVLVAIYAITALVFIVFLAEHLLTDWEKGYMLVFTFFAEFFAYKTLSRTEDYNRILGDILGFKDFITVTEQDKIKFMLEENPELFYDILPYAQVLGVTNEWESRFDGLLLEPPTWAVGYSSSYHHARMYYSMRSAMRCMTIRPQNNNGRAGRSGGGSFGGFSGGGRGGGGFGGR